jgi:hypothetical protein
MYCSAVTHEAEKHGITRVIDKADSGALVNALEELLGTQKQELLDRIPEVAIPISRSVDVVAEKDVNPPAIRTAS